MSQSKKSRLLLISFHNSYRIAPYIKAAVKLGLEVTIASEGKHSLVAEVANGLHIDFNNGNSALTDILKADSEQPFAGILGSDDLTVELAAHTASTLGLPHNPTTGRAALQSQGSGSRTTGTGRLPGADTLSAGYVDADKKADGRPALALRFKTAEHERQPWRCPG